MRGLIVLIIVIVIGGAIFLSRKVVEQPTHTIEVPVMPAAPAR